MSRRLVLPVLLLVLVVAIQSGCALRSGPRGPSEAGRFVGTLRLEDTGAAGEVGDGRSFRLLDDYKYIDPKGQAWVARKDLVVDGASIPRAFWSSVGGPWEGRYRYASVIHDALCKEKTVEWQRVHRVFYWAMLAAGVPRQKALVLYAAVLGFGPRWGEGARLARRPIDMAILVAKGDQVPLPPARRPGDPPDPVEIVEEGVTLPATAEDVRQINELVANTSDPEAIDRALGILTSRP